MPYVFFTINIRHPFQWCTIYCTDAMDNVLCLSCREHQHWSSDSPQIEPQDLRKQCWIWRAGLCVPPPSSIFRLLSQIDCSATRGLIQQTLPTASYWLDQTTQSCSLNKEVLTLKKDGWSDMKACTGRLCPPTPPPNPTNHNLRKVNTVKQTNQ